jgi:hypothetical protein
MEFRGGIRGYSENRVPRPEFPKFVVASPLSVAGTTSSETMSAFASLRWKSKRASSPAGRIRCSPGRGVSPLIALPACKRLGPEVMRRSISAFRSRRPAASELASESYVRPPGQLSGPAGHPFGPRNKGDHPPTHRSHTRTSHSSWRWLPAEGCNIAPVPTQPFARAIRPGGCHCRQL